MKNFFQKVLALTLAMFLLLSCVSAALGEADTSVYDDQEKFPGMLPCEVSRSGNEAAPKQVTDHKLRVGFCPSAVDIYYNRIWYGIEDTLKKTGYDIEFDYQAPTKQTTTNEAVTIVEGWIVQEYDAICLTISDEASLMPMIRQATEAGIPVFLFNSPEFENDYYTANVGYAQDFGGYLLGKYVGERYKELEKADVSIIIGVPGDVFTEKRLSGFYKAMEDYPNVNVLTEAPGNWSRADAADAAEDLIQAYPDMTAIVTLFDDMGLGAYQVLKSANLLGKMDLIGYDNMREVYDLIKNDEGYTSTVDTCTYLTGQNLVEAVYQYCVKGEIIPKQILFSPTVYDINNIETFDYLQYGEGAHP